MVASFFVNFFQARRDAARGIRNDYAGIATLKSAVTPVKRIKFIVGQGRHAQDMYSKVKDAVYAALNDMNDSHRAYGDRKLKITVGEVMSGSGSKNDGVILVDLP